MQEEYTREYLIGPRTPSPSARLFLPEADFTPRRTTELRPSIWYNQRRMVKMDLFNNKEASALVTLFIPFAETDPPLLFETIHLIGTRGWIMFRAQTIRQARKNHQDALLVLQHRFNINITGESPEII